MAILEKALKFFSCIELEHLDTLEIKTLQFSFEQSGNKGFQGQPTYFPNYSP